MMCAESTDNELETTDVCWRNYKVTDAVYKINVCEDFTDEAFKVWDGIQEVNATYNRSIRVLVEYLLPDNESIVEINLNWQLITNIDLNAFENVKNVEKISLFDNKIEEI